MTIFKNIKNLIKKSGLHRKEQMAIMFTIICFVLSGIFLPSLKKELSLESVTISAISAKSEIKENTKKKSSKKTDSNICKTPTVTEDTSQAAENTDKSDSEEITDTSDTASTQNNEAENKNSEETQTADASTPSPDQSIPTAPASSGSSSGSTSSSTPPSQSGGGSSSAPAAPEKVWVPPVYKTVHHDAVYQTVKTVICNYCGAEFSSTGEFQVHKDANGG